jgi:hypothetical protein
MRDTDHLRAEIANLEGELAALANTVGLSATAKRRLIEIEEKLPRLRGEVAKLANFGKPDA